MLLKYKEHRILNKRQLGRNTSNNPLWCVRGTRPCCLACVTVCWRSALCPPSKKPPGITLTNSELEISVRQRQRSQTEFQSEMVIAAVGLNQSMREKPFGTELKKTTTPTRKHASRYGSSRTTAPAQTHKWKKKKYSYAECQNMLDARYCWALQGCLSSKRR